MFWVSASAGWYQKYTVTIYWHVPSRINQPNIINWFSWQLNLVIVAWSNIVIILQFGRNRSTYCCYAGNVRRVQGFGCNIIATLKIMQYNNCSSTLLQFCNNIELLPSPSQCTFKDGNTNDTVRIAVCVSCHPPGNNATKDPALVHVFRI